MLRRIKYWLIFLTMFAATLTLTWLIRSSVKHHLIEGWVEDTDSSDSAVAGRAWDHLLSNYHYPQVRTHVLHNSNPGQLREALLADNSSNIPDDDLVLICLKICQDDPSALWKDGAKYLLELKRRGDTAAIILRRILKQQDRQSEEQRENAARLLAAIPSHISVSTFCSLGNDPNVEIRATALQALFSHPEGLSTSVLASWMRTEPEDGIPLAIPLILARMGTVDAIAELVDCLKTCDESLACWCSSAIMSELDISDPDVMNALCSYLNDSNKDVRMSVVMGLRSSKLSAARTGLQKALQDEDEDIRETALYYLGQTDRHGRTEGGAEINGFEDTPTDLDDNPMQTTNK